MLNSFHEPLAGCGLQAIVNSLPVYVYLNKILRLCKGKCDRDPENIKGYVT